MNPVPLIDIRPADLMKGISAQDNIPVGGIFKTLANYHPFDLAGVLRGSLDPTTVDNTTLSTSVKKMISGVFGGVGYVFAIGNRAGTGTKCFYRIKVSDNSVTDYSSSVATNVPINAVTLGGLMLDEDAGQVIYLEMNNGTVRRVVPGGADNNILTLSGYDSAYNWQMFRGAEGYIYITKGNSNGQIARVSGTSASWTTSDPAYTIQVGLTPKDGTTDGTYTIIIGDNNPANVSNVSSDCKVFFFLPGGTTWERAFAIPDQYIIAVRHVAGRTYVIGATGIWETSIGMTPQLVMPLTASQLPSSAAHVAVAENILYWSAAASGARVYGFGHKFLGKPILFQPYQSATDSSLHTCLATSGPYLYAGLDTPKVVAHNYGATRGSATASTVNQALPQTFQFSHAIIHLQSPLSSGQSVSLAVYNANGDVLMDTTTRSYASNGALRKIKCDPKPGTPPIRSFDDISVFATASDGSKVSRITVYGIPYGDDIQTT